MYCMKKSFVFLISITLFFFQTLNAKEIRSMFGFYLDLPKNYEAVHNLNLNELLEKNPDTEINKDLINEIMVGTPKGNMDIEYFYPIKHNLDRNNIYLTNSKGSIKEYMAIDFKDICEGLKDLYASLQKKNEIKQYKCVKNPKEIKLKSPLVIKVVHEGPFKGTKLFNYFFQIDMGFTTISSLGCEIKNCRVLEKDLINITNSIKK